MAMAYLPPRLLSWLHVAIIGTWRLAYANSKDNLSRYIRRIEAGERVVVTSHGRAVAELIPPATHRPGTAS